MQSPRFRTSLSQTLQDELIKKHLEDNTIPNKELAIWLKETHGAKATVRDIQMILMNFRSLREKEMREHIKEQVAPFVARDLRRLHERKKLLENVTNNLYLEHLKDKTDTKLTNAIAKSAAEELKSERMSLELLGAFNQIEQVNQDEQSSMDDTEVEKIMDRISALDIKLQN